MLSAVLLFGVLLGPVAGQETEQRPGNIQLELLRLGPSISSFPGRALTYESTDACFMSASGIIGSEPA